MVIAIPYDILNRLNRHKLQDNNNKLVEGIKYTDYSVKEMNDQCLDYFCIILKCREDISFFSNFFQYFF